MNLAPRDAGYIVLARKYRPTKFEEVLGQSHVVRTLTNAITLGRVHHAYLFAGPRGVGKTTTARILARALNCAAGPTPTPCDIVVHDSVGRSETRQAVVELGAREASSGDVLGATASSGATRPPSADRHVASQQVNAVAYHYPCGPCRAMLAGQSTCLLEIDGASNTGVDHVRELRESVRYLPGEGRFKIYLIDEVHMLSNAAFNALLKTLEEPPPHVKFIFATTEAHQLPLTILSRCQRFDFRQPDGALLRQHLVDILAREQVSVPESILPVVVREAQGSVRDALSLIEQVVSLSSSGVDDTALVEAIGGIQSALLFALLEGVLGRNAQQLLDTIQEAASRGYDWGVLAQALVELWRDLMLVKVAPDTADTLLQRTDVELTKLRELSSRLGRIDLHRHFRETYQVALEVARSPVPRTTFEMGILSLLELASVEDLDVLLAKLGGSASPQPQSKSEPEPEPEKTAHTLSWRALTDLVQKQSPALASVLDHVRPIVCEPVELKLSCPASSFYWDSLQEVKAVEALKVALRALGASHPSVRIVREIAAHRSIKTLAEERETRSQKAQGDLEAEARQDPLVRQALEVFDASLRSVTPVRAVEES